MVERTASSFTHVWRGLSGLVWHSLSQRLVACMLGATAALTAGAALADPPGRVGRVAETEGQVWMVDDQRGEWVAAVRNAPITGQDRVSLPVGARAVIQIGSATLRLDGDTEIEVLQLDDQTVRVQLHNGSAALQLPLQDSAREFELVTAEGRFIPRQRGHYRVDRRNATSIVTVWDGSLRFESADSQLDVREGQRMDFWVERDRTHYASAVMDRDGFTDWVVASERRYGPTAQRHVSPEMTGAHDLDRYGNWDNHPQYGAVWYPQSVADDWAPYRYGRWNWVAPWGWTWVDDAPCGFAPFHYGRWVHWHGRWGWTPGTYVARPVYAPALVAWFGGPQVSVSVNLGGGAPHVGWVALSPFEVFAPWYVVSRVHLSHINEHPWRNVRGYRDHRDHRDRNPNGHHDYANRHVRGAVVVVPQAVIVDRRPIRQDVITPAQASIWRGDRPPANGVAIKIPQQQPTYQPGGKTVGRSEVFVPPAPVKIANAAPPPKTPGGREVPWAKDRGGERPADRAGERMGERSDGRGGAMVSPPANAGSPAPMRADARGEARPTNDGASVRVAPPGGKTYRGDNAPAEAAPVPRATEQRAPMESRLPVDAVPLPNRPVEAQPRAVEPLPRAVEARPAPMPSPQAQPMPRSYRRDDPREDDRGQREVRSPRDEGVKVFRVPAPESRPAPAVVVPMQPQPQAQRAPVQPAPQMQQPQAQQPQVQRVPVQPQPQVQQQQPRQRGSDDDERGQRRGGGEGPRLIK